MADSDEEYIGEVTDDEEVGSRQVSHDTRSRKRQRGGAEWEVSRTWETLVEGADGTISSTVEGLLEAGKRKRLLRDTTPLQRGIIRHLILLLDLSQAMAEKDLRPTRYLLMLRYAQEFVVEFFEQNPISQLGILGMRDGLAVRISDLSGNPTEHISALQDLRSQDPKGLPSLQNGLEMARGALFHTPKHGTREVLIVFGALLSSDPGDIHQTINTLINDKIRVAVVGLAAQVAICRVLCAKTNGGDDTVYGVALNEQHFRELMMEVTTPPVQHSQKQAASSLLMMGFPSRSHFHELNGYPFSTNLEFKKGLAVILGHPETPATDDEINREDDLVLQAKCFYFSRKKNLTPPLDFSAYRNWLRSPSALAQSSTGIQDQGSKSLEEVPPKTEGVSSSQTGIESKPDGTAGSEPAYPSSFAHIVELITTGQPVPGIQEIPDTVLTGQEGPSTREKRRKPWEKPSMEESASQTLQG
ncbi:TFIIH basal transcription factor complex p47 subunit [Paecilomyces variotii No. 5]|uniref:TFIIH basal transcription factor complex p47 subunit n=1 Tax=Byssochlamys spectabilis (strain No. 5 / NBRC 109023) TaxID=1356009 RepID=V5GBN7_BYSSN|nr:TFIIH basal transcription factor complex p47 subunit [Paecilomyces variotii No. 5]